MSAPEAHSPSSNRNDITSNPARGIDLKTEHLASQITLIAASGEVDMATAPRLRDQLYQAAADQTTLILDLSAVSFLGSAGLATLVEISQHCHNAGSAFRVVSPTRSTTRPLLATGLVEVIDVYQTVEQALRPNDQTPGSTSV